MLHIPLLIAGVVVAGLAFDFVNGFHDASNSIATVVATRVLKPRQAVLWASFWNFIAVLFFGTGVAKTMGTGLVALDSVTPVVVLCGLVGAIIWGLITWRLSLPTSSSHALLGGYAGAAMAASVWHSGWSEMYAPIIAEGWVKVLSFIVIAPVLGLLLAQILMRTLLAIQKHFNLAPHGAFYRKGQLASSALLSLMHGSNDAQKTAGIIAGALTSAGMFTTFTIPYWLLIACYGMMGFGTLFGGWRIVRTMGSRLTPLAPQGGMCAEGAAALSILAATCLDLPVSTTHVTTGAILGVGVATDAGKVRWKIARRIAWAWIVTIPASSLIGGCVMALVLASGK